MTQVEGAWQAVLMLGAALILLLILSGMADALARRLRKRKARRRVEKQRAAAAARGELEEDSVAAVFRPWGPDLNAGVDLRCYVTTPRECWQYLGATVESDGQHCYTWELKGARPQRLHTVSIDEFWRKP